MKRNRWSRPVDEHLLAGLVLLPEHDVLCPAPALVQLAESAVAVSIRLAFAILFPEQLQGDMLVGLQLLANGAEIDAAMSNRFRVFRPGGKQQLIEPPVIVLIGQRPPESGRAGSLEITMDRGLTDRAASRDLVLPEMQTE